MTDKVTQAYKQERYSKAVEEINSASYDAAKLDRDFKTGDFLRLREWCPREQKYTGQELSRTIYFIYRGDMMAPGYCVLGL